MEEVSTHYEEDFDFFEVISKLWVKRWLMAAAIVLAATFGTGLYFALKTHHSSKLFYNTLLIPPSKNNASVKLEFKKLFFEPDTFANGKQRQNLQS